MDKREILVVDGDITQAEKLKQNLETEGYHVEVVYSCHEAIKFLERKWFDLIISSIVLRGGMNGIQFLQEIKENEDFKKIPFVMQTRKANMKQIVEDMGVTLFLTKPYKISDLMNRIKKILQQ